MQQKVGQRGKKNKCLGKRKKGIAQYRKRKCLVAPIGEKQNWGERKKLEKKPSQDWLSCKL